MSEDPLIKKVRQAISALAQTASSDLSAAVVEYTVTPDKWSVLFDPSGGIPPEELHNEISLILAVIGSLKDYLDAFCKLNDIPKAADNVINSNREAALVHDLWNIDKHFELARPPRSGIKPMLTDVCRIMMVTTADENAVAGFWFNPATGTMETLGKTELVLSARIVDENRSHVGDFRATCQMAIDQWISEIERLGVDTKKSLSGADWNLRQKPIY